MEVAMPMSGSAIDCYEDMFKEITRKLYGEDGLPELSATDRLSSSQDRGLTPIDYDVDNPILKPDEHLTAFGLAALMQNGFPTSGILNSTFQQHKGVSSTTTSLTTPTGLNTSVGATVSVDDKWISSEDNLQWTQSKIATYNPSQKLFRCLECDCVGFLPRVAEHWLGTHSNMRAFHCPQCPYESAWARCVRMHLNRQHNITTDDIAEALIKNNPVLQEITKYLQRLKNKIDNKQLHHNNSQILDDFSNNTTNATATSNTSNNHLTNHNNIVSTAAVTANPDTNGTNKRYTCSYCPYATDRRDLYTRHENIHRAEKPFQCYVCQKQFNRADHVKKHFLRMHREHPYDLNRIRRHPPKNASANINTLSTPNGFNYLSKNIPNTSNSTRPGSNLDIKPGGMNQHNVKSAVLTKPNGKKKGEKRFSCCYCSWSGVDNWCLKRHMNTHLKPFVCGLCDYKAARSERLATHVLKVHNKRTCGKCSFLADDTAQLTAHQQEHHSMDQRNRTNTNVLKNTFNNSASTITSSSCSQNHSNLKPHEFSTAAALLQHGNRLLQQNDKTSWKSHAPKQHGAARLFNYMEASDGSEPESEPRSVDDLSHLNLNHRNHSDFLEAGDVGNQTNEDGDEETELPLFICQMCGCEFEDDLSLETHQYTHRHTTTSPAKTDFSKENVNPNLKYVCRVCDFPFENQSSIMAHMLLHSSLTGLAPGRSNITTNNNNKRPRKQSQPKKMVLPFWDLNEGEVLKHFNGKHNEHQHGSFLKISHEYVAKFVKRQRYCCILCKKLTVNKYHTKASLSLHIYWKHLNKRYKCEHCDLHFRHQYQCVLHASREHIIAKSPTIKSQIVPKEPIYSAVPAVIQDAHHHFFNPQSVPEPSASAHKLGMSFFDHSFIHSTNSLNSHMPIIIPTFPPN